MARITVEDCLENVDSRFQLVLVAAKRARQLTNGSPTELAWEMIRRLFWLCVKLQVD